MSSTTIKKIIPCKKKQLIEMVLDIEKYPEFVPWCIEGKIHEMHESSDLIMFKGEKGDFTGSLYLCKHDFALYFPWFLKYAFLYLLRY